MKKNSKSSFIARAAIIAALYVALTLIFAPISFKEIQVRISEALCILPVLDIAAVPGLFVGCLLANLLGGAMPMDVAVGSIATLLGALITYKLRQKPLLSPLGPILSNALLIPLVLRIAYGVPLPYYLLALSVGAGEVLSAGVLG
ncbi:MAG: QueT transporter family protein, partial [Blautia sp.]|nr:QueT transporter family protein [Blautia sp.]